MNNTVIHDSIACLLYGQFVFVGKQTNMQKKYETSQSSNISGYSYMGHLFFRIAFVLFTCTLRCIQANRSSVKSTEAKE